MNRTKAFLALAAVLTSVAGFQPISRWVQRLNQSPVAGKAKASAGGSLRLDAALSHTQPLEGGVTYLRYDVRASDAKVEGQQPVQLVLVIDRSGSMAGEKIARARAAALKFVDQLRPEDSLGVVTFGSDTDELPILAADEEGKAQMRQFIAGIAERGGTNISAGLDRAASLLDQVKVGGVRRVVLMSDGQPTEGRTGVDDLVKQVVELHEKSLAVTALGIGYDFNATLMQRLAERGGGFYAYLDDPSRLGDVLALELAQARGSVARNVSLRLTLPPGVELVQVAGREVERNGSEAVVPLPDFAPGQTAQAYVELKLPAGATALKVGARLAYFDPSSKEQRTGDAADLAANTTADADVSEASKDAQVASDCIRAVGSTRLVAAADAFERGDRKSAFELLGNARKIFAMSADSLAGEMSDATATAQRWEKTTDAQAVAHEAKALTRKKMTNFGENNAY